MTILYKAFVGPHVNYGDVIYDEAYNETFRQKLESIQCLCSQLGATRGLSREKLYQELSLESLERRLWYRKPFLFYKISKENKLVYFFNLIATKISNNNTRSADKISLFHTKYNEIFFPIHFY